MAFIRIKWRVNKDGIKFGYKYLVESHRVNGTTRQRVVKYLGAVCFKDLPSPSVGREPVFSDMVDERVKTKVALECMKEVQHELSPPLKASKLFKKPHEAKNYTPLSDFTKSEE